MDNKTFLIIVLAAVFFFLWSGSGATATNTEPRQPVSQTDCVAAIQAQYAGQWSAMNRLQRAAAGMQAAQCGEAGR